MPFHRISLLASTPAEDLQAFGDALDRAMVETFADGSFADGRSAADPDSP